MDFKQLKNEAAYIKSLSTRDEQRTAIDKVRDDIEHEHFVVDSPEEKQRLENLATTFHMFTQYFEHGSEVIQAELHRKQIEASELDAECKRLEYQIRELQAELNALVKKKVQRQEQCKALEEAKELLQA